jgi:hypothetical protein
MACYIVSFETNSNVTSNNVKEKLKTYGTYCPITDNCWAIVTSNSAAQIRDLIIPVLGSQDRIFVIRSGSEAAWRNTYGTKNSEWLKENL